MILLEAAVAEIYTKTASEIMTLSAFKQLLRIDPTYREVEDFDQQNRGKFTNWLLIQAKGLSEEDLHNMINEDAEQIKEGLTLFVNLSRNKDGRSALLELFPSIPAEQIADISKYSVYAIREIAASKQQLEGQDVALERRITVLFNGKKLFVLMPETHEASRKYGTGTNWCTAVSNPYHYNHYKERGLIILINKDDPTEKWQTTRDGELRNSRDESVTVISVLNTLGSRSEQHKKEIDRVAQILGEDMKVEGWRKADLILNDTERNFLKQLKGMNSRSIQRATVSFHDDYSSRRGVRISVLAAALKLGNNTLIEGLQTTFGLKTLATDFMDRSLYVGEGETRAAAVIDYLRDGEAVRALQYASPYYLLMQPTLLLRLLRKVAATSTVKERVETLESGEEGEQERLFSRKFFSEYAGGKMSREVADDLLVEMITAYFPEFFAKKAPMQEAYFFGGDIEKERVDTFRKALSGVDLLEKDDETYVRLYIWQNLQLVKEQLPKTYALVKERLKTTVTLPEKDAAVIKRYFEMHMGENTLTYTKLVNHVAAEYNLLWPSAVNRIKEMLMLVWDDIDWKVARANIARRAIQELSGDYSDGAGTQANPSPGQELFDWAGLVNDGGRYTQIRSISVRNVLAGMAVGDDWDFDKFGLDVTERWKGYPDVVVKWMQVVQEVAQQSCRWVVDTVVDHLEEDLATAKHIARAMVRRLSRVADSDVATIVAFLEKDSMKAFPEIYKNKALRYMARANDGICNLLSCGSPDGIIWYVPWQTVGGDTRGLSLNDSRKLRFDPYRGVYISWSSSKELRVSVYWGGDITGNRVMSPLPHNAHDLTRMAVYLHNDEIEELSDLHYQISSLYSDLVDKSGGKVHHLIAKYGTVMGDLWHLTGQGNSLSLF